MSAGATDLIGVFDSGVGGLSVLRALREQLPSEYAIYLGDQVHVPYGSRPLPEVRGFAEGITRFLLAKDAKLIVVACNTASAAALAHLRKTFPSTPFVGMEPAVKPAAEGTLSGVVGVLATPATFQGELYASVVERFTDGVEVLRSTCPGLVERIEEGDLSGPLTRSILERALLPMIDHGADAVVLACTHFPFVIPLIEEIVGPSVRVIDPAPAVARQTQRVLKAKGLLAPVEAEGGMEIFTSGDPKEMRRTLPHLLVDDPAVERARWTGAQLTQES